MTTTVVAGALLVASCGNYSNMFSIFRTVNLQSGNSVITDAKQRIIVNVSATSRRPGRNTPKRIICAEPSPDVAQSLTTALSAAVKVSVQGRGEGQGQFARSTAESIAQLGERLATIQLLRDGLYRACEAYANGAITDIGYALVLSGIDDVMVTLLSGELAAGAFGRSLAAIAGTARATTASVGSAADIKQLQTKITEQEAKVAEAQTKYDATEKESPDKRLPTLVELNKEKAKRRDLQRRLDEAKSKTASSSAAGRVAAIAGLTGSPRSSGSTEAVAKIHRTFMNDTRPSAILVSCIIALDRPRSERPTMLQEGCIELFKPGKYYRVYKYQNNKGEWVSKLHVITRIRATRLLRNQRFHIEKMADIEKRTVMTGLLESFAKNCAPPSTAAKENCTLLKKTINSLVANK